MKILITIFLALACITLQAQEPGPTIKPLKVKLKPATSRDTVARDSIIIIKTQLNQLRADMNDSVNYLKGLIIAPPPGVVDSSAIARIVRNTFFTKSDTLIIAATQFGEIYGTIIYTTDTIPAGGAGCIDTSDFSVDAAQEFVLNVGECVFVTEGATTTTFTNYFDYTDDFATNFLLTGNITIAAGDSLFVVTTYINRDTNPVVYDYVYWQTGTINQSLPHWCRLIYKKQNEGTGTSFDLTLTDQ